MARQIGTTLRRYNYLNSALAEQYHLLDAALGLSESASNILYVLYEEGSGCSQSTIYKLSGMSRKTAGSSLQKLSREGILTIRKSSSGRGNQVFLTERGEQLAREKIAPMLAVENDVFTTWSEEEKKIFLTLNERYLSQITEGFAKIRERCAQGRPEDDAQDAPEDEENTQEALYN